MAEFTTYQEKSRHFAMDIASTIGKIEIFLDWNKSYEGSLADSINQHPHLPIKTSDLYSSVRTANDLIWEKYDLGNVCPEFQKRRKELLLMTLH